LRGAFGAFHSVQKIIWRVFGLKSTNSFDVARGARSECVGMGVRILSESRMWKPNGSRETDEREVLASLSIS
jgi:hypothetical protein